MPYILKVNFKKYCPDTYWLLIANEYEFDMIKMARQQWLVMFCQFKTILLSLRFHCANITNIISQQN